LETAVGEQGVGPGHLEWRYFGGTQGEREPPGELLKGKPETLDIIFSFLHPYPLEEMDGC